MQDEAQLILNGRICPPHGKTIENVVLEASMKDEVAFEIPANYQSEGFRSTLDLKSFMDIQAGNNMKIYVVATDAIGKIRTRDYRIC